MQFQFAATSGYALSPSLLTPYRNTGTEVEENYSISLTRERITFGRWKNRFRCLQAGIRLKLEGVCSVIMACAILHNVCLEAGEADFVDPDAEEVVEDEDGERLVVEGIEADGDGRRRRQMGENLRRNVAEAMFRDN